MTTRPPVGKRTTQLLREAIVLAHVEGWWWTSGSHVGERYPSDSEVVAKVLYAASRMQDSYPALGRLAEQLAAEQEQL